MLVGFRGTCSKCLLKRLNLELSPSFSLSRILPALLVFHAMILIFAPFWRGGEAFRYRCYADGGMKEVPELFSCYLANRDPISVPREWKKIICADQNRKIAPAFNVTSV